MKTIKEYVLPPKQRQIIEVPLNSVVLAADTRIRKIAENATLHILLDEDEQETKKIEVIVSPIETKLPDDIEKFVYLNSVKMKANPLPYHVFIKEIEEKLIRMNKYIKHDDKIGIIGYGFECIECGKMNSFVVKSKKEHICEFCKEKNNFEPIKD